MKRIKFFFRILAALLIVQIYACEKIIEHLPGKPKNCRIKRIKFHFFVEDQAIFYYNKWGNPDSVIYNFISTAMTNQIFRYNHKQQLIQARFEYADGNPERLHKFGYTKGQITSDTFYTWPTLEEPEPLQYVSKSIWNYEYDNLGRIIKETRNQIYPDSFNQVLIYDYDANGNRSDGPTIYYDNYTNPNVLHPIWQFLSRDYSLNNRFQAVTYNNFRLPTKFDVANAYHDHRFLDRNLARSEIEYECK